jgi:hypothetical protein
VTRSERPVPRLSNRISRPNGRQTIKEPGEFVEPRLRHLGHDEAPWAGVPYKVTGTRLSQV